jgi:hypothetical protein
MVITCATRSPSMTRASVRRVLSAKAWKDDVVRLSGSLGPLMQARRWAVDHRVISIVCRERSRVLGIEGLFASREHGSDLLARHF